MCLTPPPCTCTRTHTFCLLPLCPLPPSPPQGEWEEEGREISEPPKSRNACVLGGFHDTFCHFEIPPPLPSQGRGPSLSIHLYLFFVLSLFLPLPPPLILARSLYFTPFLSRGLFLVLSLFRLLLLTFLSPPHLPSSLSPFLSLTLALLCSLSHTHNLSSFFPLAPFLSLSLSLLLSLPPLLSLPSRFAADSRRA